MTGEEFSKVRFEDRADAQERRRVNAAMKENLGMGAGVVVGLTQRVPSWVRAGSRRGSGGDR